MYIRQRAFGYPRLFHSRGDIPAYNACVNFRGIYAHMSVVPTRVRTRKRFTGYRLPEDVLQDIERRVRLANGRTTQTQVVLDLIRAGQGALDGKDVDVTAVLKALHGQVEEFFMALEGLQTSVVARHQELDRVLTAILKTQLECQMILRALTADKDAQLLSRAQQNAREAWGRISRPEPPTRST